MPLFSILVNLFIVNVNIIIVNLMEFVNQKDKDLRKNNVYRKSASSTEEAHVEELQSSHSHPGQFLFHKPQETPKHK